MRRRRSPPSERTAIARRSVPQRPSRAISRTRERGAGVPAAGLRLRPAAGAPAFRTARTSYGPINPPERRIIHGIDVRTGETRRTLSAPLSDWNRWDTIGRTIYLAESLEAAYAEALAPFRRRTGDGSDPLEADAAAIGLTLEEFIALVEADCGECSFMRTGNLPASWRHARGVYVHMPPGRWQVPCAHETALTAVSFDQRDELLCLLYTSPSPRD